MLNDVAIAFTRALLFRAKVVECHHSQDSSLARVVKVLLI